MTDKFIIETSYCIQNSDLCVVGEMLGYDWNDVCDAIGEQEIHGMDGSGYTTIEKSMTTNNEMVNAIVKKLFEDNPNASDIKVLDDF